jgi:hypothetical protein
MSDPKPPIRYVDGGVVSAEAYPSDGTPDWKAECARLEELVFQRTCERDAALARLKALNTPSNADPTPWGGYAKCRTCDGVLTTDEFSKGSHCESCQQVVG